VETLFNSASAAGISPQVEMELERLWLDADHAVPFALVVNELVSNSLLHGRPAAGEPVRIQLQCKQEGDRVCLTVRDNGGGYPEPKQSSGQGMNIIRQLVQVNLRGQLVLTNRDRGVYAELRFPIAVRQASA
jgi:two-component sensor histidine kinase